jgi:hypothetical protein
MQEWFQCLQQLIALCLWKLLGRRRHFVFANSIIDVNPLRSLLSVLQVGSGTCEIEATFFQLRAVAFDAVCLHDLDN